MTDFIYLYRTGETQRREAMGTPERAQQSMQKWVAWLQNLEAKGHVKDRGQPLDSTGKIVRGKPGVVTDGPFVEAKDLVAGFTIIQARDLAHAAELAGGCPILENGGAVEVRPVMQM